MRKRYPVQWHRQRGVAAVETALILPVLLFGIMMLFELGRIGLLIGAGSVALERSLQDFRQDRYFYDLSDTAMADRIESGMAKNSYGLVDSGALVIDVMTFDNLSQLGGVEEESEDEVETGGEYERDASRPPVVSVTVDLSESFMTPLPGLFGLGNGFQYQYRHLLGNLVSLPEGEY